ncbi:MAG: type 4a pilus biogenesis protein PilO [Acidobacteria bacterium]|nr:type 4a pilus biogenesis protein PilO [Acidobacteriota bacterium]
MTPPARFDIRERMGAVLAIFVIWLGANLAFAFLVNLPRTEQARTIRQEQESFQDRLAKRRAKIADLKANYDRVMGGNQSLQSFFDNVLSTKRRRMIPIQKEIRDIARKFNINPESISYGRQIFEKDSIVRFSAILPLTGPYESLRAFINALERSENFIIIDSVSLADSKEGGVILSLDIAVSTYFFDSDVTPKGASIAARG